MSQTRTSANSILRQEALGFSLITVLCWAAEVFKLPHRLYDDPSEPNWNRALFRSLVVIAVWIWVHFVTKRLLKRLHELEEFLLVCSWCRKVGHEGKWLTTEEYFGSKFHTATTHGICPECSQKAMSRQTTKIPPLPPSV